MVTNKRVSAAAICDWLDITRPTFSSYVDAGVFERQPVAKGYDLRLVVRQAFAHSRQTAAGRGGDDAVQKLSSARARQATAAAETAEFKNSIHRGEFVNASLVGKLLGDTFILIREKMLGLPGKVSAAVQPNTPFDREIVEKLIQGEVYQMLNELAEPTSYPEQAAKAGE